MSERVIPEDLRERYDNAIIGAENYGNSVTGAGYRTLVCLIERIADLNAENERLKAPVSDEERAQFAIHYVKLVQPDRIEPAMLLQNVNRLIAFRAAKEKP